MKWAKRGLYSHAQKSAERGAFAFLGGYSAKKLHQAEREKKSWHSIIELHSTSNIGENALKGA